MSATSSLLPGTGRPAPTAIEINARASEGFDAKLAETVALLREAAQLGPATQASSLGAEDMVITHLINAHALPISIFVLETGADRVKIRFTKTAIGSVEKLNMDKAESKTDKK